MGGGLSSGISSSGGYRYGVSPDTDGETPSRASPPKIAWLGKTLELPPKPFNLETYFQTLGVLGTGMLGCVRLVQHKKSKKFFALKSMRKSDVVAHNMLRHVESERAALLQLTKLQLPFLTRCFGSFQSSTHIHLVLEYAPGGELLRRLHQVGGKFTNDEALFYAAELVAFVEGCHAQHYMYRDLKPENVLLDAAGHIKVVDLGFVRAFADPSERCTTSVGTPQYLAPEQLTQSQQKRSYTSAVDWWALACMVFEMVAGHTPFATSGRQDSPFELYTRIVQGRIRWPRGMHSTLKDLLRRMLAPDLAQRLCSADAIKQHTWFAHVDWQDVRLGDVAPPYVPNLLRDGDRAHFDEYPAETADNFNTSSKGAAASSTMAHDFRNF